MEDTRMTLSCVASLGTTERTRDHGLAGFRVAQIRTKMERCERRWGPLTKRKKELTFENTRG